MAVFLFASISNGEGNEKNLFQYFWGSGVDNFLVVMQKCHTESIKINLNSWNLPVTVDVKVAEEPLVPHSWGLLNVLFQVQVVFGVVDCGRLKGLAYQASLLSMTDVSSHRSKQHSATLYRWRWTRWRNGGWFTPSKGWAGHLHEGINNPHKIDSSFVCQNSKIYDNSLIFYFIRSLSP